MPGVDALWLDALAGRGLLAVWLLAGAAPESWTSDLPLHSVLACHPFADLDQWTEFPR